ncbi:MAG: phage holin family protein [Oscillospiraceae bacterium]|nr:phage holin family protein [Oscillospiraceae bacterium]
MLIVTAVAHIIDMEVIGDGDYLRTMAVLFYISNEAISVFENAGALGVPLPKKLTEILEQLKDDNGGENDEIN